MTIHVVSKNYNLNLKTLNHDNEKNYSEFILLIQQY